MSGYVLIHRSLIDHCAFRNDAEAMAFAWMVVRASWKETRVRYKGRAITLARGQLAISVRDLANAMDRDKSWVERLFARLKSETMIKTSDETGVNVITICNFDKYQPNKDHGETLRETAGETDARQRRDTEQLREEVKEELEEEEAAPPARARAPTIPVDGAFDAWNVAAAAVGWPIVQRITDGRKASVRSRLRTDGIDGWQAAITRARASPYLGQSPPPFFTFDWFVKPANFLKVIEGNYDRNRPSNDRSDSPLNPMVRAGIAREARFAGC